VTPQHSLPSGRYPLLGPDFHRLDRTSFAWRTYLITSSARLKILCDTLSPSALAVEDQLVLCRRPHRQIGGLFALEDAVDIPGRAAKLLNTAAPKRLKMAPTPYAAEFCDGRHCFAGRTFYG
jgi:hypothetical protein